MLGDSTVTVPAVEPAPNCHFIFIDGGHTEEVAAKDLRNFQRYADTTLGTVVVVDDIQDPAVLAAWDAAERDGIVAHDGKDCASPSRPPPGPCLLPPPEPPFPLSPPSHAASLYDFSRYYDVRDATVVDYVGRYL